MNKQNEDMNNEEYQSKTLETLKEMRDLLKSLQVPKSQKVIEIMVPIIFGIYVVGTSFFIVGVEKVFPNVGLGLFLAGILLWIVAMLMPYYIVHRFKNKK